MKVERMRRIWAQARQAAGRFRVKMIDPDDEAVVWEGWSDKLLKDNDGDEDVAAALQTLSRKRKGDKALAGYFWLEKMAAQKASSGGRNEVHVVAFISNSDRAPSREPKWLADVAHSVPLAQIKANPEDLRPSHLAQFLSAAERKGKGRPVVAIAVWVQDARINPSGRKWFGGAAGASGKPLLAKWESWTKRWWVADWPEGA